MWRYFIMNGRRFRWRERGELVVMVERRNGKWRRVYAQDPVWRAYQLMREANSGTQNDLE